MRALPAERPLHEVRDGKEGAGGDPGERDLRKSKFWQTLEGIFKDTIQMICERAKARGIDLDAPNLAVEARIEEKRERRLAAMEGPLVKRAMAYLKAVDAWMKKAGLRKRACRAARFRAPLTDGCRRPSSPDR